MAAGKWTQDEVIALKEKLAAEENRRNEEAVVGQVLNSVNNVLQQTIQADPSVKDAHDAWRNSMGNEMLAMGYTQQQAMQTIRDTERQHALFIAQNNIPVGEYLKRLAGARGWQAKPAQPATIDTGKSEAEKITQARADAHCITNPRQGRWGRRQYRHSHAGAGARHERRGVRGLQEEAPLGGPRLPAGVMKYKVGGR
jgi:hypothetical protein